MLKILKFARNYNHKLDNPIFTTVRSLDNYDVEIFQETVRVFDEYEGIEFQAKVIEVERELLSNLSKAFLFQDMGLTDIDDVMDLFDEFGISPFDEVLVLTLERTDQ